ncbi:phosphopentomutase [Anaerotruncus rubiinfantis]|uniref:phosphopentomutase n=1 Tax=Anaerotruncus rubiinfantis TaxID=1720200 RepID=UPI001897009E
MKRVFLIVLDSFGIGEAPDAAEYGDAGSNTLRSCFETGKLRVPNLQKLGLFNIDGICCGEPASRPRGAYGRMREASAGKDTTCGHWEIAGIISQKRMPTYPDGFPTELIQEFERRTGRRVLCNRPASGTQVILDYGQEHEQTGALIVYTSADSVFQIAAHESVIPVSELYEYCKIARALLTGENAVGRVIARPFTGKYPNYKRTSNRHDFSLAPPRPTVLDAIQASGLETIGVGKIFDIFAGRGISRTSRTQGNDDGMAQTIAHAKEDFSGLCFVNLVDFDMVYGHRNNADGYAEALSRFDGQLGELMALMGPDDAIMITADHGCDPGTASTDHSREYVPLLIWGGGIEPVNLGTRPTFADAGETAAALLGVAGNCDGTPLARLILRPGTQDLRSGWETLVREAFAAREKSYFPHSAFAVGAALLSKNGRVFHGCNVENASYSVTCCAERTALFKAVSEGERSFSAIAIAGGKTDCAQSEYCYPCGVCRQALAEFCPPDFPVIVAKSPEDYRAYTLEELLPHAFGPGGKF